MRDSSPSASHPRPVFSRVPVFAAGTLLPTRICAITYGSSAWFFSAAYPREPTTQRPQVAGRRVQQAPSDLRPYFSRRLRSGCTEQ
ncbi:hypothetical protein GUJ93_ZPchr0013g37920 [Zizania palustris]|uniref:Uncharacterized protein n=1 Tax=Zizania palustris TaxID=103762 RepID=A0A8J5WWF0_ZIZPA|nr:hypothetical protein GUJ93_ZPchr0013g37920 [Zizania palustris]